jgi:hypothetical protein
MKRRLSTNTLFSNSLWMILPAAIILVVAVVAIPVGAVYKITHPPESAERIDPSFFTLEFESVEYSSRDGNRIKGWWIPSTEGSPGILLAPGYGMTRSDALSLASELHKLGFNIFLYAPRGSSVSPHRASSFGLKEKEDLCTALEFIQGMGKSDRSRIGIWGVDVGAYASLWAASVVPEVRAIAADGAYASFLDFLDVRIREEFGTDNGLLRFGCRQVFRIWNLASGSLGDRELPVARLSGRTFLFITGENRKELAGLSAAVYDALPSNKEMAALPKSFIRLMDGSDLKNYDIKVAEFFEQNLQ